MIIPEKDQKKLLDVAYSKFSNVGAIACPLTGKIVDLPTDMSIGYFNDVLYYIEGKNKTPLMHENGDWATVAYGRELRGPSEEESPIAILSLLDDVKTYFKHSIKIACIDNNMPYKIEGGTFSTSGNNMVLFQPKGFGINDPYVTVYRNGKYAKIIVEKIGGVNIIVSGYSRETILAMHDTAKSNPVLSKSTPAQLKVESIMRGVREFYKNAEIVKCLKTKEDRNVYCVGEYCYDEKESEVWFVARDYGVLLRSNGKFAEIISNIEDDSPINYTGIADTDLFLTEHPMAKFNIAESIKKQMESSKKRPPILVRTDTREDVINPSHYKQYPFEAIEMMEKIWGPEKTAWYCEMTAFKYRMRLGHKDGVDQEMGKEKWYLDKAKELKGKI